MSEGEDGKPCIKWRRKQTTNIAGEGGVTAEKMKEAETGIEEKTETQKVLERRTRVVDHGISVER